MTATRRLKRTAPVMRGLLLAVAVLGIGCFRPKVLDGGFKCKADGGTHACPEGFTCATDERCWAAGHDAGSDVGDAGSDGDGPTDVRDATADADASLPCFDAKPGCDPSDAGICDPTCQTGCGCREKCSVNILGTLTCNPLGPGPTPMLLKGCTIQSSGFDVQTDNCAPGQVCIDNECGARCYQFCSADSDCTNSSCTRDVTVAGGKKFCDVPFATCVPLPGAGNTGCGVGATAQACFLSPLFADKTLCDCSFGAMGTNEFCQHSRDCIVGLVCVDPTGSGNPICRQACRLGASDCGPSTCVAYMDRSGVFSTTYGFCN